MLFKNINYIMDPESVFIYEKWIEVHDLPYDEVLDRLIVLKNNGYHQYISYNNFAEETCDIPEGYKLYEQDIQYVKDHICDPSATYFDPEKERVEHSDADMYKIYFNGLIYITHIDNNKVYVYTSTDSVVDNYSLNDPIIYTKLVATFQPKKIFIGKSDFNDMTEFSGGYGDKFDGNSILLEIDDMEYVYIGYGIHSFKTDEKIIRYVSSMGNNLVPYPYAETENYCYTMEGSRTPVSEHPDREKKGNVSYINNCTYEQHPITVIHNGQNNTKYSLAEEKYVRFKDDIKVQNVPNTSRVM